MDQVVHCPEHPGLVNDPAHFLNFIDRNCVPYTWPELFFFAGGCLLWVVAYGIIIRNTIRDKYMESAAVSVCSNIAWEFIWSFPFRTDAGYFMVWTYRAWFFLDVFIFYLLIKHGPKQITQPAFKKHFTPAAFLITGAFVWIYYFFVKQGMDTPIGSNSAYICQLILSSTCLLLLLGSKTADGFSLWVGWLRSVGTGMNTIMMFMHYPENHVLHAMGVISAVMDAAYITCLIRLRRVDRLRRKDALAASAPAASSTSTSSAPAESSRPSRHRPRRRPARGNLPHQPDAAAQGDQPGGSPRI